MTLKRQPDEQQCLFSFEFGFCISLVTGLKDELIDLYILGLENINFEHLNPNGATSLKD